MIYSNNYHKMNQTQKYHFLCYVISLHGCSGEVAGGRGFGILSAKCINIITK